MSVFKHQRWVNNVFINIIAEIATRFHNAQILNDVDINVFNSQFKILNFQKSKSVFVANIEVLLAKKRKMQTRVIQQEINDMQIRLNASPSSAAMVAPKASKTATAGNSIIKINENLWIFFLIIKYLFISQKLFTQIANNKFIFINIFKFSTVYKLLINKMKYLKFENTIEFIHKKKCFDQWHNKLHDFFENIWNLLSNFNFFCFCHCSNAVANNFCCI